VATGCSVCSLWAHANASAAAAVCRPQNQFCCMSVNSLFQDPTSQE
jgi:hypothetical protein